MSDTTAGAHGSRFELPEVDPDHALAILDGFVDHRIGEGSPMSAAWYGYFRAASEAVAGYEEHVRRDGPGTVPEGTDPATRALCTMVEIGVAARRIPPEDEVDLLMREAEAALDAAPSREP